MVCTNVKVERSKMSIQYFSVSAMVVDTSLCSIVFVLLTITYTSPKLTGEQVQWIHVFSHTTLLVFGNISILIFLRKVCTQIDQRVESNAASILNSDALEVVFLWIFAVEIPHRNHSVFTCNNILC